MAHIFLVQECAPGYQADLWNIREALEWEQGRPDAGYRVVQTNDSDLTEILTARDDVVPVGTIEFVERILGGHILPLNIPEPLAAEKFTGRKVWRDISATELSALLMSGEELFIKSASQCKAWAPCTVTEKDISKLLPLERFFASQYIELFSEWRVFVFHREIQDARPYAAEKGAWFVAPSLSAVDEMVKAYADPPPAYTLDVGVTPDGKTVIIEAHPFIACGLYGFSSSRIPAMLAQAYHWQKNTTMR